MVSQRRLLTLLNIVASFLSTPAPVVPILQAVIAAAQQPYALQILQTRFLSAQASSFISSSPCPSRSPSRCHTFLSFLHSSTPLSTRCINLFLGRQLNHMCKQVMHNFCRPWASNIDRREGHPRMGRCCWTRLPFRKSRESGDGGFLTFSVRRIRWFGSWMSLRWCWGYRSGKIWNT